MGLQTTQMNCNTPVDMGSPLQVQLLPSDIGLDASISASGSSVSDVVITGGYKCFTFALQSSQNGSVSIQRYADQEGLYPVGSAITVSLTGGTATDAHSTDSIPFQSMIITVNNSGGSTATVSNCLLLLQAN